jgi:peroxiredoxin
MPQATSVNAAAILSPGVIAPDFELEHSPGARTRLSHLRDSNVVLAFYPADWSPVCGDQIALYNEIVQDFTDLDAKIFGVSVDSAWCHQAYAQTRKLRFPLLADFEPKGEVSRKYGVYDAALGTSERALFVIDAAGVIRWSYLSPVDVNPGADGILTALEAIRDDREVRA